MAQWLKALAALAEALSSALSTSMEVYRHICKSSVRRFNILFLLPWAQGIQTNADVHKMGERPGFWMRGAGN